MITAAPAGAVLHPAATLDGPGADVLEVADAALAEDGTGGVVYRRRAERRSHIYVARFLRGRWEGPLRVDTGQAFDSSWPRIAAGRGGRLLVSWVQELGVGTDRLYAATIDPGAASFQRPIPIDMNVGEAKATDPDLVMNRSGSALIAYRVTTDEQPADAPAGWQRAEFRLARWRGGTWAKRGPVNRAVSAPVPPPDPGNGPKLAIDNSGNGVVAWQEPDDELVPRIWARRVFSGTTVGIPLAASPLQQNGVAVGAGADRLSVSTAGIGVAAVAFRQLADPASGFPSTAVMVNALPDSTSTTAGAFKGARVLDDRVDAAGPSTSVAVNADGEYRAAFSDGRAVDGVRGDLLRGTSNLLRLDGENEVAPDPRATIGPDGEAAWAWLYGEAGRTGAVVREQPVRGDSDDAIVAGRTGGPVSELRLGGSGLGDAIVAFRQGTPVTTQLVATYVDAAPSGFGVNTPADWVRPTQARISWDPAPDAIGGVTYSVALDGQIQARRLSRLAFRPPVARLDTGRYRVQVVARDREGQERASAAVTLKVDGQAPTATVRRLRGRRIHVRTTDKSPDGSSGIETVRVTFGDGRRSTGPSVKHRYARPGRYQVTVTAVDKAGNRSTTRRRVVVR